MKNNSFVVVAIMLCAGLGFFKEIGAMTNQDFKKSLTAEKNFLEKQLTTGETTLEKLYKQREKEKNPGFLDSINNLIIQWEQYIREKRPQLELVKQQLNALDY